MKLILIPILVLLACSSSFSQVNPSRIIDGKQFHENALLFEKDKGKHLLNLEGFIKMLKSSDPKVIIDVRAKPSFVEKHIKGAINITMEELTDSRLKEVAPDKNTPIIIYCDNTFFPTRRVALTTYAYPTLMNYGYQNVFDIEPLWKNSSQVPNELEPYWESGKK